MTANQQPGGRAKQAPGWSARVTFVALAMVVVAAALPPFVGESTGAALMAGFRAVCHQFAERTPHIDGVSLALCHRCFGIFGGLASGALLYLVRPGLSEPAYRRAAPLATVVLFVIAADWTAGFLWDANTPVSRFVSALPFGLWAGLLLGRAAAELTASEAPAVPAPAGGSLPPSDPSHESP